jgi:[ribosomal protein S5]-alanine N-acetyltransferase
MASEIETERLRLRPLAAEDLEPMWAIYSQPGVRQHLITKPQTPDEFLGVFRSMLHYSDKDQLWGVADKATGQLIGRCGFYEFSEARTPELAFLLSEDSWGRGLATEASQAVIDIGFGQRGWKEMVAVVRPANSGAKRVLQKAGFALANTIDLRGAPAELHQNHPGGA